MTQKQLLLFMGMAMILCQCSLHSQTWQIEKLGIYLLDKEAAEYHITKDDQEHFFKRINSLEMSLQRRKAFPKDLSKEQKIEQYKDFLREDVMPFNKTDKDFLAEVFQALYEETKLAELNLPDSILLIKVKGRHYGNSVYYTRENCIIIPENVLIASEKESFSDVMLHELAHIYSRYNPAKRKALYELIGFKKTTELSIPPAVMERMIYNPDGLELNWITAIDVGDESTYICPLLVCRLNPNIEAGLFANFQFALYEVQFDKEGIATIIAKPNGNPGIDMNILIPGYYNTIGTNTDYIIHPDEVIADNFMLVLKEAKQNLRNQSFKGQNLELYNGVKSILLD